MNERVGQLFMVGEDSRRISSTQLARIHSLHIGSVILLGNTTSGRSSVKHLTDQVRSRAGSTDGARVLLAADQEGGLVQRLKGSGFSTIPSARTQSKSTNASLESHATTWAKQLKAAGIDADLAPVADVVPTSMEKVNQPIGVLKRGYGPDPKTVAAKVGAFVKGMHRGGIATSVKHFPGLGRVRGNTDFDRKVVDSVTTRHDADLAGFARGISNGTDMVMVSSATYSKIDARHPATFSTTVLQGMIRSDQKFGGVIISDDLNGKALSSISIGSKAVRFIDAGGDLAIVGDPALVSSAVSHTVGEARSSRSFGVKVTAATTKVLTMKAKRGLTSCS
ncbi:MAG: glycoside hydrolase family 3 N-terminal domain-containing protein [Propionibacteriaceae bacterium]